ncbi:MAG TPA: glycosyltransferase family 39 protein [Bauldia sp.]|nr:glycosyltransferase family 39 protein [Bauldia sp.]
MSLDTAAYSGALPVPSLHRIARAILPLALILIWTAAVRLPFYVQTDKDEFFFSVIASEWLRGGLPYVATFDIKPPGLFLLFAVAQSLFGASQATIKGMEIVAVATATWALYAMLRASGVPRVALWVAILYPVYTLTLAGTVTAAMILQLPFLVVAFAAAMVAIRDTGTAGQRLAGALVAGLAVGFAGTIKQTAVFEAAAIFVLLLIFADRRRLWALCATFVVGAALPVLSFAAYFAAMGHLNEMVQAVVVLAMQRTAPDVLAAYGADKQGFFTPLGVIANTAQCSLPLLFLWGGAIFVVLRRERVRQTVPDRVLVTAGLWLAASLAGVMAGYVLCSYYVLATIPPLLILAGAFFCHGIDVSERKHGAAFALSIVSAAAAMLYIDHRYLFTPDAFLAGDFDATRRVSASIASLHPAPDDRLLVLNRGLSVYVETGLLPPSPYFHPTQLLGVFHTPSPDPLGASLEANPRFIVIADANTWHITEQRARIDRALAYVAANYRQVDVITGAKDSFTLYQYAGEAAAWR